MKVCRKCKSHLKKTATACGVCGTLLEDNVSESKKVEVVEEQETNKLLVIILIILVLLLISIPLSICIRTMVKDTRGNLNVSTPTVEVDK